jgi:hypothetical protein
VWPLPEADNYLNMKKKYLDRYKINVAMRTGDGPIEASTLANP